MQNIETLASSLDAQVLDVMQSLQFSDSPLVWSTELAWIFPEIYCFMARTTKRDIRAVAQFFQRTSRIARLSDYLQEFDTRTEFMRLMLSAVDLMTSDGSRVPRINGHDLQRLREALPIVHNAMDSVTTKLLLLKDEVAANLEVFGILEESWARCVSLIFLDVPRRFLQDAVELLLWSLAPTIPETYITQGRGLIGQLVCMWSERRVIIAQASDLAAAGQELQELEGRLNDQREVQTSILTSFKGLVGQIKEVPTLRLLDREFDAHEFSGASSSYRRLLVRRMSLHGDASRLQTILDHFINVIEDGQE